MTKNTSPRPPAASRRRIQFGQATVEFAIGVVVLLLLLGGLVDFARAYYFSVGLQGAAYIGARHGAWFDYGRRQNVWLDDADITNAVNNGLAGSGLAHIAAPTTPCPTGSGGLHNPPYSGATDFPTGNNTVNLYIWYTKPGGSTQCGLATPPGPYDYTWRQGDVNVILAMNYTLVTGYMQNMLNAAGGIHVTNNAHFTIQGGY